MAYEWRTLTEKEYQDLADYGQKIMYLQGPEKAKIQTERANAEIGWNSKTADINAEIAKNNKTIQDLRTATVDGKNFTFSALTDEQSKYIIDLKQRNDSLAAELAKIATDRAAMESGWKIRTANIDTELHTLSDLITYMREPTEV